MRAAGLLVTTTAYVAGVSSAAAQLAVETGCGLGALPFVGDIGLTRLPLTPLRCD